MRISKTRLFITKRIKVFFEENYFDQHYISEVKLFEFKELIFSMNLRVVFFLLCLSLACQSDKEERSITPNILFIMADDLGSSELGCYGGRDIQTPNIDQLAAEGLMFTQAYSGNTVCAPARSTLMTGLHSGHSYVRGNTGGIALPDSVITLAEVLNNAGYKTGGFGKWGLGEIGTSGVPEQQGFDEFVGYYHQIHAHDYYPDYLYDNSKKIMLDKNTVAKEDYSAYRIFDRTKAFIEKNKDVPFFCYAAYTLPHGQFEIPDSDPAVQNYRDKDWSDERKNYSAMVSLLDKQVGEMIQQLKDLDIYKETIVIFCSDNGGLSEFAAYQPNGTLRGFKRDMYEGGLRIPMIVKWTNKTPKGARCDLPVYFPDLMPTLADITRAKDHLPRNIDGMSIVNWLKNPSLDHRNRYLYWEYPHYDWKTNQYDKTKFKQALRTRNWKMIKNGSNKEWEFYNLDADPSEQDDMEAYHPSKMQKFKAWIADNRTKAAEQIEPERVNGKPYR